MRAYLAFFAFVVSAAVAVPAVPAIPGVRPAIPAFPAHKFPTGVPTFPSETPTGFPHGFDGLTPEACFRAIMALFKKMSNGKPVPSMPTDVPDVLPTEDFSAEFDDMEPEAYFRVIKALIAKIFAARPTGFPESVQTDMPHFDSITAMIDMFEKLFAHSGALTMPTGATNDTSATNEVTEEPEHFRVHFPNFDFFDRFAELFKKMKNFQQVTANPVDSNESSMSTDKSDEQHPKYWNGKKEHRGNAFGHYKKFGHQNKQ